MLPSGYELPVAIVLILGGALACLAGYRLFRVVLGIYGFILGAMLASSVIGVSNTIGMIIAAIAGGLIGAVVLIFAYFVGIALVGAGLAALMAHVIWSQVATADPPPLLIVLVSVVGAIGAMLLQRYVIIVGTAFGGAWTLLVGALAAYGIRAGAPGSSGVWILYPLSPMEGQGWLQIVWIALGLVGMIVQLAITARRKR